MRKERETILISGGGKVEKKLNEDKKLMIVVVADEGKESEVEIEVEIMRDEIKTEVLIIAVVSNGSRVKVRGGIRVGNDLKGVEGRLEIKALLRDDESWLEMEPRLEIETKDVVASHGATVGTIDEKMVFYLMSRGVSRNEAEKLWLEGWLGKVIGNKKEKERVVKLLNINDK